MRFLVLGGGAQGSAAAFDLVRRDAVAKVVVADLDVGRPAPFLKPFVGGALEMRALDAKDEAAVRAAMDEADGVVCALPYFFNHDMARLAVAAGAHYCDLGGNTEIVERQRDLDDEAAAKGLSVVPDCGLAPGMVNILAQAGIDAMDEVASVKIFVGGLPQHPKPPLNYQVVYSLHGVLDYSTTPSLVLEGGEPREVEALTEVEPVDFPEPVGRLEAFHTAGGISTMPYRYRGQVPSMVYKTLRYPGHAELMKAMRDLGLFDLEPVEVDGCEVAPRDVFIEVAGPRLRNPEGDDLVALRVEVAGASGGTDKTVRYELLDYYDADNGVTAMMRTTGYSLAVTALMQVDGRIREKGVRTPDECVPPGPYISELAAHGIAIERTDY